MTYNKSDLEQEIRELHSRIQLRRMAFDQGMKQDMEFGELKKIFLEIKEMEKRLELCFEESHAQKEG
jgi:hypothetical protein